VPLADATILTPPPPIHTYTYTHRYFLKYLETSSADSPLYVFDSRFVDTGGAKVSEIGSNMHIVWTF